LPIIRLLAEKGCLIHSSKSVSGTNVDETALLHHVTSRSRGQTALQNAMANGWNEVADFLRIKGAR